MEPDLFKKYPQHKGLYVVEGYIRNVFDDTVVHACETVEEALDYIDAFCTNDEGEHDMFIYKIDEDGVAWPPSF